MSGDQVVSIRGLTKNFGKVTAVSGLDLDVCRGQYMGLLGPNGAGKSTTLKCVTGMTRPDMGSVKICGADVFKSRKEALGHTGCVIDSPDFYPEFSPEDVLRYAGRMYGIPKDELRIRSRDVLEIVRLWDCRRKSIGGFSKGMKQRMALAQALISNPSLLILDEPTAGLDPRGMVEMREVLLSLKDGERTVLFSSHILKEIEELCDHVTMLSFGSSVVKGGVRDLLSKLRAESGKMTLEIHTVHSVPEGFISDVRGYDGVVSCRATGERSVAVEFEGTEEGQAGIVDLVYRYDLGLVTFTEQGNDLERLYMEFTRGHGARP